MVDTDETRVPRTTRAIAALAPGGVEAADSFREVRLPVAELGPHDLLVEVRAVSVNPLDIKMLASFDEQESPRVLGHDAAGVVVAVGAAVSAFRTGDEVYYAGTPARPGTNAEHHVVDERIVGHKPRSLGFAASAAVPLTTITAWETLFDRMGVDAETTGTLLVVGGAGVVGSMLIQLARQLSDLTVIATASRDESRDWVERLGAHHVVDHHDLREQVRTIAPEGVHLIFSAYSPGNEATYADLLVVHGQVVAIDGPHGMDIAALKAKSQTWHWESMGTRPEFEPDSTAQRELLDAAAALFDDAVLVSTLTRTLGPLTAGTLQEAHRMVEGSAMIGKVAVVADSGSTGPQSRT